MSSLHSVSSLSDISLTDWWLSDWQDQVSHWEGVSSVGCFIPVVAKQKDLFTTLKFGLKHMKSQTWLRDLFQNLHHDCTEAHTVVTLNGKDSDVCWMSIRFQVRCFRRPKLSGNSTWASHQSLPTSHSSVKNNVDKTSHLCVLLLLN